MNVVVTTSDKPEPAMVDLGRRFASRLGVPFTARSNRSLARLRKEFDTDVVLVITKTGPILHTPSGSYFFHLHLAQLRIKNLADGNPDHMVEAMQLTPGKSILDCTLGLGADAIVASYIVGNEGQVTGVENSPLMASLVEYGLSTFETQETELTRALRTIKVIQGDYNQYLRTIPDDSYDIVYFDPMFRRPIDASSQLRPIRDLVDPRPLNTDALQEACRIAKQRVVVKENKDSKEFKRLGITSFCGGKYSSVQFGIIETGDGRG